MDSRYRSALSQSQQRTASRLSEHSQTNGYSCTRPTEAQAGEQPSASQYRESGVMPKPRDVQARHQPPSLTSQYDYSTGVSPPNGSFADRYNAYGSNSGRRLSITGVQSRSSPYGRPLVGPRSPPQQLPSPLVDVEKLKLSDGNSPEDEGVEDRRKRAKTPPDCCAVCGVTDTAEWRRGPAGSRMLCNGCGLCAAKRAKERASEGYAPVDTDAEIIHELRCIGAERFKVSPDGFELPAGAVERIRQTRDRTHSINSSAAASAQRLKKHTRNKPGSSKSSNLEREAAAGLIGLRRASISTETATPAASRNPTFGASPHTSVPRSMPMSPPLTAYQRAPSPQLGRPQSSMASWPLSEYTGVRHESLSSGRPMSMYNASQQYPPQTQYSRPLHTNAHALPPMNHLARIATPVGGIQPGQPNLNRRRSLLDTFGRQNIPLPPMYSTPGSPPLSAPNSSLRSTMGPPSPLNEDRLLVRGA